MTTPRTPQIDLEVEIRELPAQHYLGIELEAARADVGSSVASAYGRIFAHLGAERLRPAGPPFLVASRPAGERMQMLVAVPTAAPAAGSGDIRPGLLPGGRAAVCLHRGPYEWMAPVYAQLEAWIAGQGHVPAGAPREVYLNGPGDVTGPEDYLTELVWPIA